MGKTTINGMTWAELKQREVLIPIPSEGRDKNVMLAGRNILSGIEGTGRLIDHERMGEA